MSEPVALPPPAGIGAAAYPPVTRRRAALAVGGTVLAYLVVLGPYVGTAVLVLLGRARAPHTARGAGTGLLVATGLLVVGLLLAWGSTALLGRATARDWWWGRRSGLRGGVAVPAAWVLGALALGIVTYTVVLVVLVVGLHHDRPPTPADPLTGVEWVDLLRGLVAGPQEELVVVALPLVVAARLGGARLRPGRPPLWLWAVLVVARLAYHVYYGPGVLELLPWAVVVPWLFWRTRQIWPIVLAHSAYDVSLMLAAYVDRLLPLVVLPLLLLVTVGAAAVVRARVPRERRWSLRRVAPAGRGVVPQDLRYGGSRWS